MKSYFILLPVFLFSLLQGAFLPLNLVLLVILFYSALKPDKKSLLVAFLSGLMLDLAKGTPLGFSSFLFLIFSFMLILYSRRFGILYLLLLPLPVFVFSILYNSLILASQGETLWLTFISLVVSLILRYFYRESGIIKLKTSP